MPGRGWLARVTLPQVLGDVTRSTEVTPREGSGELQRGLQSWRYDPYINPAGVPSAACFPVTFRVVSTN